MHIFSLQPGKALDTSNNTGSGNSGQASTASVSLSSVAPGSESDAADAEFEPTPEMMMDEFDDERTLDEAEAEAANEGEDQAEEISNLQKVLKYSFFIAFCLSGPVWAQTIRPKKLMQRSEILT